jgi:uncharacterized protein
MLEIFSIAFILGITGSLHCVGMCGPIALSIPINNNTLFSKITGAFIYNFGRVITYSFLGLLFGMIGKTFSLFGLQQALSILVGVIILIWIFKFKYLQNILSRINFIDSLLSSLRKNISKLFATHSNTSLLSIGLLNGFLPCGLVYLAIAGAITSGNIINSMFFMMAFGLGTLPLMFAVTIFGSHVKFSFRNKLKIIYPYLMGLMACILILRGMGLGVPYLSPKLMVEKKEIRGCCTKH